MKYFIILLIAILIGIGTSVIGQSTNGSIASPTEPQGVLQLDMTGILMAGRKPNGDAGVILVVDAGRVICSPLH